MSATTAVKKKSKVSYQKRVMETLVVQDKLSHVELNNLAVQLFQKRTTALTRKKTREILYLYGKLLDGWCVRYIEPGRYHLTRSNELFT